MKSYPEVTDSTFSEKLNKHNFTLVIFSSPHCGYCQIAKKNLIEVIDKLNDIAVYEYIVDKNSVKFDQYNIKSVPAMIFFENGKVIHRFFGVRNKSDLYYQLKSFLPLKNNYVWPE